MTACLAFDSVSVRFGGLSALDNVSLSIDAGTITGLIGPNGAGKTTLFNVATGLQLPTHGSVVLDGRDVTEVPAYRRARMGLARTFQRLEVFDSLTVRENVQVARDIRQRARGAERRDTDDIMGLVGLRHVGHHRVDTLPTGLARLVELARAIATGPSVILCDECSSGLTDDETTIVREVVRRIADDGIGVFLVEHDMSFVMSTCERIWVLDFGHVIASGTAAEIQSDPDVRTAYLGDPKEDKALKPQPSNGSVVRSQVRQNGSTAVETDVASKPLIDLRGVTAGYGAIDVIFDVDLTIRPGELFALLGPNGAGKSTVVKVINGELDPSRGEVLLDGVSMAGRSLDQRARSGICTIPEGRGIFPNLTVDDNLQMSVFSGVPFRTIRDPAYEQFPRLAERRTQLAGTLSGGEQQMLALSRALVVDPRVLIIDELSMGLAPTVVEELYRIVADLADLNEIAILIIEQFAHDVLDVATTAGVMIHGRITEIGDPSRIASILSSAYLADRSSAD